jgi:hypothetical protein
VPVLAVGDDVEEAAAVFHVVGVAGVDGFPAVAGRVNGGLPEGLQEPVAPVCAVVGECLAGPFAGDQDPAPGVAEVLAAVCLTPAGAWREAEAGVFGLDAVPEPVGASRRARLVPQRFGELVDVGALAVGLGLVAVGDVLGEVFGQVADATRGVLGSGQDTLGVEPGPEPGHVQRLVLFADAVGGLVPGGQDLAGGGVEVRAGVGVPDRQLVPIEADGGGAGPPDLVVGRGEHAAQIGAGDGAADGEVDVGGEAPLGFDGGEVLDVVAEEAAQVLHEPVEQGGEVQGVAGRGGVVVAGRVGGGAVFLDPAVAGAGEGDEQGRPECDVSGHRNDPEPLMGSGSFWLGAGWAAEWLVVAGLVDGELADEFAGGGVDDPDVQVVNEHEDGRAGVLVAGADVVEFPVDAQGELAGWVGAVGADAVVGVGGAVAGAALGLAW